MGDVIPFRSRGRQGATQEPDEPVTWTPRWWSETMLAWVTTSSDGWTELRDRYGHLVLRRRATADEMPGRSR